MWCFVGATQTLKAETITKIARFTVWMRTGRDNIDPNHSKDEKGTTISTTLTASTGNRVCLPFIVWDFLGRLVLVIVLIVAVVSKAAHIDGTRHALETLRIVPENLSLASTYWLISVELVTAILLCTRITRSAGLLASCGLFSIFGSFAVFKAFAAPNVDCGCFPGVIRLAPASSISLNALSFLIALFLFVRLPSRASLRFGTHE